MYSYRNEGSKSCSHDICPVLSYNRNTGDGRAEACSANVFKSPAICVAPLFFFFFKHLSVIFSRFQPELLRGENEGYSNPGRSPQVMLDNFHLNYLV